MKNRDMKGRATVGEGEMGKSEKREIKEEKERHRQRRVERRGR